MDTDGNGVLEFPEFLALMATKIRSADTEEELVEAFKIFDRDGDQLLNKEDLMILMPKYMMVVRLRKVKSAVLLPIKPSKKQVKRIPTISIPLFM